MLVSVARRPLTAWKWRVVMSPSKQEVQFKVEYAAELLRIAEGDFATAAALKGMTGIGVENAFYMAQ